MFRSIEGADSLWFQDGRRSVRWTSERAHQPVVTTECFTGGQQMCGVSLAVGISRDKGCHKVEGVLVSEVPISFSRGNDLRCRITAFPQVIDKPHLEFHGISVLANFPVNV